MRPRKVTWALVANASSPGVNASQIQYTALSRECQKKFDCFTDTGTGLWSNNLLQLVGKVTSPHVFFQSLMPPTSRDSEARRRVAWRACHVFSLQVKAKLIYVPLQLCIYWNASLVI